MMKHYCEICDRELFGDKYVCKSEAFIAPYYLCPKCMGNAIHMGKMMRSEKFMEYCCCGGDNNEKA